MNGSAVLPNLVEVSKEPLKERHMGPILAHPNESVLDIRADPPGIVRGVGAFKVNSHFVVGYVFDFEIGLFFVEVPSCWYGYIV